MSSNLYQQNELQKYKTYQHELTHEIQTKIQELIFFFPTELCNIIAEFSVNTRKCLGFTLIYSED